MPGRLFSPEQNGASVSARPAYRGRMGEVLRLPRRDETPRERPVTEPLWRELVGTELRRERLAREERLSDVAERAGVSTQYLSEVERYLLEGDAIPFVDLRLREAR
jgi:hypothetical protein